MKPHQLSGGGNWIPAALLSNSRGTPFDPGGSVGRGEKPFIISEATGVGGAAASIRTSAVVGGIMMRIELMKLARHVKDRGAIVILSFC